MRFLCLAYGDERDWKELSKEEQDELLANDEVIRQRGNLVAAVGGPTTVRVWDGSPSTSTEGVSEGPIPLAGFSIIDARNVDEVIDLVANTPCARAQGAIEIRPLLDL